MHPNRRITLLAFDKFFRLVRIEPTINVFRNCCHLIVASIVAMTCVGFFTFFNRPIGAMKGTLSEKPTHIRNIKGGG